MTLQALETGATTNWTGSWNATSNTYYSASQSYADSPSGNYGNNTNKTYTYVPTIDLTNATEAGVSFYAKWAIESNYDFCQFQVSTDGGTTWIGQCGNYTVPGVSGGVQPVNKPLYEGTQPDWVLEEINLSDYLGQVIKIRFQLRSDGGAVLDGFYFDDFKILYNLPSPTTPPTASFTASEIAICAGESIVFNDASTGSPSLWTWDFGDGESSNDQNPSHVYSNAGQFNVSLTASNSEGSDTQEQLSLITVNALPTVTIQSSELDNTICIEGNESIALTVDPVGAVLSGSALIGNVFDPSVEGSYTITATFVDANGCQGTASVTLIAEDCGLSLASEVNLSAPIVKPNPNTGIFSVQGIDVDSEVKIYDPNGKLILETKAMENHLEIVLPNLRAGIYYLQAVKNGVMNRIKIAII
jgi:PKD repeat protein